MSALHSAAAEPVTRRAGADGATLASGEGLVVRYGGRTVLDHVSLEVRRREVVSLIGPNGAGKTTAVRALLGLIRPDAGTVRHEPGLVVGYVPQRIAPDTLLPISVRRFLAMAGRSTAADAAATLDEVGMAAVIDRQLSALSGGEYRRVLLARALLRDPDLLVLDEPVQQVDFPGQLGCFMVWRRMAYFGDSVAHSALLGVVLGIVLGIEPNAGIIIMCIALALLLHLLQQQRRLATDTLLGILAHGALALGLVGISFLEGVRVDLMSYLFGDILAVTGRDLLWIWGGGGAVLVATALIWRPLLAITVHEELARAEGVRVGLVRLVFTLLIALAVAIAMKIIGLILIVALLIIPAATARRLARSPEQMALLASLIGAAAVAGGLHASLAWDTPSGPSIVVAALALFTLGLGGAALASACLGRVVDSARAEP